MVKRAPALRIGLLILLVAAMAIGRIYYPEFHEWFDRHRVGAPLAVGLILVGVYILVSVLALPVWWLQCVAGHLFGLWRGLLWCQIAATIGAVLTVILSHVLAGEWVQKKIAERKDRLASLDEKLGHDGILVVMAVRLMHVMPFGLSNYAFGLTKIRPRQAAVGTLLGNIPAAAFWVGIGAGHDPRHWRFWAGLAAAEITLLIPLAVRYGRPRWFSKMGLQ